MMKKDFAYAVNGADGGAVHVPGNASIAFPANGIVGTDGAPYSGTVQVAAAYLNPDSNSFYDYFSGDNQGLGADGKAAALVSLGVLRVDMRGSSGQTLKFAAGKTATLTYPKPSGVDGPASMPLWHFDQTTGQWKEEGSATLTDGAYIGTVSHFSDWNLDYKGRSWNFTVRILCDTLPLPNVKVRSFQRIGISDRNGMVRFLNSPADVATNKVEVLSEDNDGRYFANAPTQVTVYSSEASIHDIKLDSRCPASVRGVLAGCTDDPVEGLATVTAEKTITFDYAVEGRFLLQAPDQTALILNATDVSGNKMTPPMALTPLASGEQRDLGRLKICGALSTDIRDISDDTLEFIYASALSLDGSLLATTISPHKSGNIDGILLFDTRTGKQVQKIPLPTGSGGNLEFSQDNRKLSVPHFNNTVEVFDISVKPAKRLCTVSTGSFETLNPDGKTILGVDISVNPPKTALYSAEDGKEIKTLHPTGFGTLIQDFPDYYEAQWIPSLNAFIYMVQGGAGIFRVWSADQDTLIREIKTGIPTYDFGSSHGFSRDGLTFWSSAKQDSISIFNTLTGEQITTLDPRTGGGTYSGITDCLTAHFFFMRVDISGVRVIQQFRLSDGGVVATFAVPTGGVAHPKDGSPIVSLDEKTMELEISMPAEYPDSKEGFRIYKLP
jgi:WD40 repeat protein